MNTQPTLAVTKFIRAFAIIASCIYLASCGGSGETNNPPGPRSNQIPDYSKLKITEVNAQALKPANETSLELHLKNGLRLQTRPDVQTIFIAAEIDTDAEPAMAEGAGTDNANYSGTNTHVEGVDESDYVKYDGSHIFVSTQPQWIWGETPSAPRVRILETDPAQATAEEVGSIEVNDDRWGAVSELYLVNDATTDKAQGLATLRSSWSYFAWTEPGIMAVDAAFASDMAASPTTDAVQLSIYDVSNPATPALDWNISIDGYLQESRKIGNTLYLVTQYSPYLYDLYYYPINNQEKVNNEKIIKEKTLQELLPKYSINGGDPQPLLKASDCYIPVDIDEYNGLANLTTIVAIDLQSKEITSSTCLNANVQGIYASQDNLYIGGSSTAGWWVQNGETIIHKFNLQEGEISYRSTGSVPGFLSWDSASFRMSEYQNNFRIVTSERDSNGRPVHRLTILQDSPASDLMQELATLPNSTRPTPIGKPGEDIYSVRFRDDRAFIVTYERIDPLYVLDLSVPEDPKIAGELEVPGFSSYLHPINDTYLLGFGRNANNAGTGGVKVSLYDVSDSSNPVEVNSMTFGESGTYSEALNDLHAATFLFTGDDQLRFTMPIVTYDTAWVWSHSGLHLFEVNGLANDDAELTHVGEIISEEATPEYLWPYYTQGSRSVLHDDAVYFMTDDSVFSSFWDSPEAALGPY